MNSKLGIMPSNDGKIMRLSFPPLSAERREEFIKVVKDMAERGRVTLRTIRRDANDKVKKIQSEGHMSEDDKFRFKADLQKRVDDINATLEALFAKKETEMQQ